MIHVTNYKTNYWIDMIRSKNILFWWSSVANQYKYICVCVIEKRGNDGVSGEQVKREYILQVLA